MVARLLLLYAENLMTMTNDIYAKTEYLIRRWWLSIIVGIAMIALGFVTLIYPVASYYTIALWLGIAILLSGIVNLLQSISSQNYFVHRGWVVVASIAYIIIGIVLMFNILLSEMILPLLLGCWLLYRSSSMLIMGLDLRQYGSRDAGWMIFYSVVALILSILIVWMPGTLGTQTVVLFVGFGLILYGMSAFSMGMRLWEVHRHAKTIGSDE